MKNLNAKCINVKCINVKYEVQASSIKFSVYLMGTVLWPLISSNQQASAIVGVRGVMGIGDISVFLILDELCTSRMILN